MQFIFSNMDGMCSMPLVATMEGAMVSLEAIVARRGRAVIAL